ncbi:MAG: (2Fe-2S)-binding protein [Candidatus Tritonobacter lacicola]|nr:(2Fe-2S)-binding protein [Candidatus Tritonobacter lacicola]
MKKIKLTITVNGKKHTLRIAPNLRLLDLLRDELRLTGTKEGCGIGECGACTVILDGKAVNSCLVLAGRCDGSEIITIEGLARDGALHPLQQSFIDHGAVQCGFCTPGMILSAKALLDENQRPTEKDIRVAIAGNLCRCTGYKQIVQAIQTVADREKTP